MLIMRSLRSRVTHIFCTDLTQGSGVILYIKDSIPAIDKYQDRNFQESTWCNINLSVGDNIIIGCVYRKVIEKQ